MSATRRLPMRHDDFRESKLERNPNFKESISPTSPKHGKRTEGLIQEYSEGSSDDDEICRYDETDRCLGTSVSDEYGLRPTSTPYKGGVFDSSATGIFFPSNKNRYISSKSNKVRYKNGEIELNDCKKAKNVYPDLSDLHCEEEQRVQRKLWKYGPSPMIKITMAILIIAAITFIVCFATHIISEYRETEVVTIPSHEIMYKEVKQNLQLLYKDSNQPKIFWSQVMSQIENLFETEPLQPSVLLVLIPANSKKTAVCLVHKLQEIVSSAFKDQKLVMLDGQSSSLLAAGTVRHQLDESLSELNSQHVAIIHNLEKIPPEAAMILHSYCDNENAPHKRALIILTIGSNLPYDSLSIESASANIDEILEALWRDKIREDDIPAILSRIANAPILVKPEPNYVIENLCPYK